MKNEKKEGNESDKNDNITTTIIFWKISIVFNFRSFLFNLFLSLTLLCVYFLSHSHSLAYAHFRTEETKRLFRLFLSSILLQNNLHNTLISMKILESERRNLHNLILSSLVHIRWHFYAFVSLHSTSQKRRKIFFIE
jgi:hypothetical protein